MNNLPASALVEPIGLALLHFLWQGTALGLILWVVLLCTRKTDPRVRYGLCCATLAAMAICPLITGIALRPPSSPELAPVRSLASHRAPQHVIYVYQEQPPMPAAQKMRAYLPAVVLIWLCGVVVLSIRTVGGLWLVERLRRKWSLPAPPEWQGKFDLLRAKLGVARSARLLMSDRLRVPSTVGVFRAVVILPASVLMKFPPEQVETLILHELAHVRRHDYLVNLLQTCVETLLFYHPAVWWVSHVARLEREHCCDEIVVRSTGETGLYARTLAQLEQQLTQLPNLSPDLTMSARGGHLMHRVTRILTTKPSQTRPIAVWPSILVVTALAAGIGETVRAKADNPKPPAKAHASAKHKSPGHLPKKVAKSVDANAALAKRVQFEGTWGVVPPGTKVSLKTDPTTTFADWVAKPDAVVRYIPVVRTNSGAIKLEARPKDITIEFDRVQIQEALKQIDAQVGFSYSIAPPNPMERFRYQEVQANIVHQSLEDAIRAVCYSAGAKFRRGAGGTYFIQLRSPLETAEDGSDGMPVPSGRSGRGGFGGSGGLGGGGFGGGGGLGGSSFGSGGGLGGGSSFGGGIGRHGMAGGLGGTSTGGLGGGASSGGIGGGGSFGGASAAGPGGGGGLGGASSGGLGGGGSFGGSNGGLGGGGGFGGAGSGGLGGGGGGFGSTSPAKAGGLAGSTTAKSGVLDVPKATFGGSGGFGPTSGGSGFGGGFGGGFGNTEPLRAGGVGATEVAKGGQTSTLVVQQAHGKFRLHMVAVSVTQAAFALARSSGKSIVVDADAKKESVDVIVTGVGFATALECICNSSGCTYRVHDGIYTITRNKN